MARRYDSRRRKEAAAETRQRILQAALKLHWDGVTEFGPLADEAGCSVATVRKHFPTKESLFRSCTRTFAETLEPPDLDAVAAIGDPGERLAAGVTELCRIHEAMLGYAWLAAKQRDESAVLDTEMLAYEGLVDAVTEIIAPDDQRALTRSLLDVLTYRAFRTRGGLSPEETRDALVISISQFSLDQERPNP